MPAATPKPPAVPDPAAPQPAGVAPDPALVLRLQPLGPRFRPEHWRPARGPAFDRTALERLASGPIKEVFGPAFAVLDPVPTPVRMPMPPLLLCDAVTGLEGEPLGMGRGTIWTETTVPEDAWYLHRGVMPAGVFLEAGQADLLLVSWLGINAHTSGDRVYRLLGCDVVFLGPLPVPGDHIEFQIIGSGFARQGDTRLFFFHSDCRVNGELRAIARNGQAGFFTRAEMAEAVGLLWTPAPDRFTPGARVDPPERQVEARRFDRERFASYLAGDMADCFGPAFAGVGAPLPSYRVGRDSFLHEILDYLPRGGPAQRGYARSLTRITPQDWYFASHFKDDPCMPGSLMIEACTELLAFYLTAAGFTAGREDWRFEPVRDTAFSFRCRGQITPETRTVEYELFVDELHAGPEPVLFAHVLGLIDGKKGFGCERMGLRLVPPPAKAALDRPEGFPLNPPEGAGPLDWRLLREGWCRVFGDEPSALLDFGVGLARRFLRRVSVAPDFLARCQGRPVLFLANHQTGVESLVFLFVAGYLNGLPMKVIAKKEHRDTMHGRLMDLERMRNGEAPLIEMLLADRSSPMAMLGLFRSLGRELRRRPFSLLVHTDGTRAETAGSPTQRVSSVLVELALEHGLAIVPVRFLGGLPLEARGKLEFPPDFGSQDLHFGAPIAPEELGALGFNRRTQRVLEAMNSLGPPLREEAPLPGDPAFARKVALRVQAGLGETAAAFLESLLELPVHSEESRQALAMLAGEIAADTPFLQGVRALLLPGERR